MPSLKPALRSEAEALMVRLANECAHTLQAYKEAEAGGGETFKEWRALCNRAWAAHDVAVFNFENTFPEADDWERIADRKLMRELEEADAC